MKQNNSELLDIGGLIRMYISKWYWFAISVAVCCLIGFGISRIVESKYIVRSSLIIEDDGSGSLLKAGMGDMSSLLGGNTSADDEAMIVNSHAVLREVSRQLGIYRRHTVRLMPTVHRFLYTGYPVEVTPDPAINLDTLQNTLIFRVSVHKNGSTADIRVKDLEQTLLKLSDVKLPAVVNTGFGKFTVSLTPDYPEGESLVSNIWLSGYDDAADFLAKELTIGVAAKNSAMINLEMQTPHVAFAKDVLNTVMATYNNMDVRQQMAKGAKSDAFITDRLTYLFADLTDAEQKLEDYKERNGVRDVIADGTYDYTKLAEFETQYTTMRIESETMANVLDILKHSGNDYTLIPVVGKSEAMITMITEYNKAVLSRMRIMESARPDNATLQTIDSRLSQSRQNIISSMTKALEQMREQEKEYYAGYTAVMNKLGGIPTLERKLRELSRQQKIKEEIYLFLLQKQEENAILLASSTAKGRIIDAAYSINKNIGMSTFTIMLMAMMFGLVIPPVALYVMKVMRTKFSTRQEMETRINIPVLGEVCTDKTGDSLVVRPGGSNSTAELFRLIRTNLQFVLGSSDQKVVLLTSTKSGEGKSFISINLAASLAILGKKTLIIGMDVRKPRLAQYLGIEPRFGLTEYLSSDKLAIGDIITRNVHLDNLDVIISGPIPPNPSELLASDKVDRMIEKLRGSYDYILIDSAPVGMVSDTFMLARVSDATVYVTRANYTTFSDLDFAESIYQEKRLRKLSVVINGTEAKKGYGYGYGEKVK